MERNKKMHFLKVFKRFNDALLKIEEHIMNFFMIFLIAAIMIQVVCRYIFKIPTPWAEELARYVFIWLCWIGGAYAINSGAHIEINLMDSLAPKLFKNPQKAMWIVGKIAGTFIIIFLTVLLISYIDYFRQIVASGAFLTATKLSVGYTASSVLVGAALGIIHSLYLLARPFNIFDSSGESEVDVNE